MEISIENFIEKAKSWPTNPKEADSVAERIATLASTPFAVVFSTKKTEGIGIYSKTPLSFSRGAMSEYLTHYMNRVTETGSKISQIDAEPGTLQWATFKPFRYLYAGTVENTLLGTRKRFGLVLTGSESPLTATERTALLVGIDHLSSLAGIADLEAEVQLRNQFLSIASHELKTPLTSIYGILQLQERMLRTPKKPTDQTLPERERHHNFLKMVIRQVERLNELIDGLLDVSRIQNGRFMIEPTETDIAKLLKECVQSRLYVLAEEGSVKLHVESIHELIAWVDPVRMEEVVTNLVINAIRFSPEGGVVWIRLRDDRDSFRLTVRDQGPSIPIEDRERIFQPFERVHRTARMGGLGLGLFISRQIALLHGGNVSLVESVPGKGNVIEAYFPKKG